MHLSLFRTLGLTAVMGILQLNNVSGQCPGGTPFLTQTSKVFKVGDANNTYALSQFNPNTGTLYSVDLTSQIYLTYAYRLTNASAIDEYYNVNVIRTDSMYAYTASHPAPLAIRGEDFFTQIAYRQGNPAKPGVKPGVSDTTVKIIYPRTYTQTFDQSVVPFLGTDSMYIKYVAITSATYGGITGNNNVAISNQIAKDSIVFTLTYKYCPTSVLASSALTLTSRPQDENVVISWTSQDNYSEGYYEILKSTDGRTYNSISKQAIDKNRLTANNYLYKPLSNDGSTGFFRVKQTNNNGEVIYSRIITVSLPQNSNQTLPGLVPTRQLTLFPTITNSSVNMVLPEGNSGDEWQVNIISLSGQILQQSLVKGSGQTNIRFNSTLQNGMHIVNVINKRTNTSYKGKFIVQN